MNGKAFYLTIDFGIACARLIRQYGQDISMRNAKLIVCPSYLSANRTFYAAIADELPQVFKLFLIP